jgi:hypothetical protein
LIEKEFFLNHFKKVQENSKQTQKDYLKISKGISDQFLSQ